ncbi:MAG: hypothetical protein JW954_05370 [Dehalococcoidaceae bacterium]|nr:hypothetical protein [Dehalococcoidaceae bacterium]
MSYEIRPSSVELKVNGSHIELTEFVASFIAGVAGGLITSLKDIDIYSRFAIHIDAQSLDINVDGSPVKSNAFVENLVRNTLTGMVRRLKAVESVDELELKVETLN